VAHRFEPFHAGLGGGAQGIEPVAVGLDRVFRRLCVLQRRGCCGGVHRGAFLGQAARARLGVGAAFGGARGFRFGFDPRNRFVDRAHFRLGAVRLGRRLRLTGRRCRQVDVEGRVVVRGR
jgi:hypothetical protein